MKGDLTMSGGYVANAGGIFVSGNAAGIPEEVDRHINLMIYQLASYMNAKDQGAAIQNAAKQALGGEPHPGEIQATPLTESDPAGYFATDIRVNNGADHAVTVGVSPAVTYFPESDPDLYYILDLQDLSLILTILQLAGDLSDQTVLKAASAWSFSTC
jgi:hypothetical protein